MDTQFGEEWEFAIIFAFLRFYGPFFPSSCQKINSCQQDSQLSLDDRGTRSTRRCRLLIMLLD